MKYIKLFEEYINEGVKSVNDLKSLMKRLQKSKNFTSVQLVTNKDKDDWAYGTVINIKSKLKSENPHHLNDLDEFTIGINSDDNNYFWGHYDLNGHNEEYLKDEREVLSWVRANENVNESKTKLVNIGLGTAIDANTFQATSALQDTINNRRNQKAGKKKKKLNEAVVLSKELGGYDHSKFLKIAWSLSIEELKSILSQSKFDLKWLNGNSRGLLGTFNRRDALFVSSRITLLEDLIKHKTKDPNFITDHYKD